MPVAEWSAVATGPRPDEEAAIREVIDLALARLNNNEKSLIEGFRSGLNHDQNAMIKGVSARTVQRTVEKFRKTIEELLEVAA
jgi:DNA-directed RNA polymerase specialized sigma24 family protein